MSCTSSKLIISEPPIVGMLLEDENNIVKGVPHEVECTLAPEFNKGMQMWINVNGRQLPQELIPKLTADNKTFYYYARPKILFTKADNQKEVLCGVDWGNKVFTSGTLKVDVLCKCFHFSYYKYISLCISITF